MTAIVKHDSMRHIHAFQRLVHSLHFIVVEIAPTDTAVKDKRDFCRCDAPEETCTSSKHPGEMPVGCDRAGDTSAARESGRVDSMLVDGETLVVRPTRLQVFVA